MEIKSFFNPIIKWWWLVLIAVVLATVACFLIVRDQPPVYNASTTLLIGRAIFDPNPSSNDIYLDQQLGNLYSDMANTEPFKLATMKALDLTWLPDYTVKPLADSQFIQVVATDTDPVRAAKVASALADQLVALSPGGTPGDSSTRQDFVSSQLALTQKNIVDTTTQITEKQNELGKLSSAHEITQVQTDIQTLQAKLTLLQTTYASLLANSQGGATNTLKVVEPALVPVNPVGPGKPVVIALAGIIGLLLSSGTAYLLEFIDDTIKTPEEITKLLNLPVIGYFAKMGKDYRTNPYIALKPGSLIAEAFRTMRNNLTPVKTEIPLRTIMITSANPGEGKTSVAVNLAASFLNEGKSVILVDSDFRKPDVHNFFGMENQAGLGEVLNNEHETWEVLQRWKESNLYVLTSGHRVSMLDKLLQPDKIEKVVNDLKVLANVIIFDSPPFIVSDAVTLAPYMDGMILVVKPEYTRRRITKLMSERMLRAGVNILGVVMNCIPIGVAGYASYYQPYAPHYYFNYGEPKSNDKQNQNKKEKLPSNEKKK
jgi:capsular exopolysaccharide synthesis family protein